MWKSLYIADTRGSEGGIIIADEEYKNSCRITLEKCEKLYAVTCGVYGAMVHTAFSDPENYQALYDEMKKELQEFIDTETTEKEELDFYDYFCSKF
ncbi:MAG: hypothetical protein K2J77_05150 [Oscillospiraceae bacterium]|nr:hypothetical protein [Oscillospiraceae bacterium]